MTYPHDRTSFASAFESGDIQVSPVAFWSCAIGATLVLAFIVHGALAALGIPVLSIFEVVWNCFVWLMPSSFVLGLGQSVSKSSGSKGPQGGFSSSSEHAAKSEVLRNVFGLNTLRAPSKAIGGAPPGLGNWDNSCYQNSILQALASLKCLATFFENLKLNIAEIPEDTTVISLNDLIDRLNDLSNSGRHLWTPHKLKSMSSWQQQDAQEYFSKLVDAIEKDTAAGLKEKEALSDRENSLASVLASSESEEPSETTTLSEPISRASSNYPSQVEPLRNPLEGLLAQRVGCTRCCFSEGISCIPFNCITLPLGRKWSYEIDECLEDFTTLESIEGVECAKCTLLHAKGELQRQLDKLASPTEPGQEELKDGLNEYRERLEERLAAVTVALQDDDFEESTLAKKCQIPGNRRTSSTKSKQVTIMKPPQGLVLHINRSLFDECTGAQLKNYADVQYPSLLDMSRWCIGGQATANSNYKESREEWEMDPARSMIPEDNSPHSTLNCRYSLRAVITHLGRHENGHYVCYRKLARASGNPYNEAADLDLVKEKDTWWRLSDENVSSVSEEEASSQGGAFMLFYERMADDYPEQPAAATSITNSADDQVAEPEATDGLGTSDGEESLPETDPAGVDEANALPLHNQSLSPAKMRTAGVQRRTSQEVDHFKFTGAPMVAPT